jgi:hypothetical protein
MAEGLATRDSEQPLRSTSAWLPACWVVAIALVGLWAAQAAAQDVQAPRLAPATQAPANWFLAELPGTSEALSRAIGHETAVEPGRLMLEIVRLAHSAPATQDANVDQARRQLVAYLDSVEQLHNAGDAAGATVPTVRVPLPLSPDVWATRVFDRRVPVPRLGAAILRDRSAALLYYGLAALDAETLAYFSTSRGAPTSCSQGSVAASPPGSRMRPPRTCRLRP